MSKSLVIVESPAKARTINRYLGDDFLVKSCVGHIRDLTPVKTGGKRKVSSEKNKAADSRYSRLFARMGVNPEQNWRPNYGIIEGKEKIVTDLAKQARGAGTVFLATDRDREGEAIAWHLQELLKGKKNNNIRFFRVIFNEITASAIHKAFEQPGEISSSRVEAQQARRFLDRVVGFMVSPLLWKKIGPGLSAGRVQSVAVRLIVEREREIQQFIPREYWDIHADTVTSNGAALRLELKKHRDKAFKAANREEADAALKDLKAADYKVHRLAVKPAKMRPQPPLITSTLQRAASTRLGFGVRRTMTIAQRLYEEGFITYMRTDATTLSTDAVTSCRTYIEKKYGTEYLQSKPVVYKSRSNAQEAHEAIRPTDVSKTAASLPASLKDCVRLYELIWSYFVACQMAPAEYQNTRLTVHAGDYELVTSGRILRFPGFLKVLKVSTNKKNIELPPVQENELLKLKQLLPTQRYTAPKPRYGEAALVKELEKRQIGRPSTYANIISTIQDRGYVALKKNGFHAQKIGEIVTDRLTESFSDIINYDFTANLEKDLDKIADRDIDYKSVLNNFYQHFSEDLNKAEQEGGMRPNKAVQVTEYKCTDCGRPMNIRTGRHGMFLSCGGYSLTGEEHCKRTVNLAQEETEAEPASEKDRGDAIGNDSDEVQILRSRLRCPVCQTSMQPFNIDNSHRLHICSKNPDCEGYKLETGEFTSGNQSVTEINCGHCDGTMQLKSGRFGKYYACDNSSCGHTRKVLANGQPAPLRIKALPLPELKCSTADDYFVLREGAAGLFLSASSYPKIKENRKPLVQELRAVQKQLDEKFPWLATSPDCDPDNNPFAIRFDKKNQQYYLNSEKDGKPTEWYAHYEDNGWQQKKTAKKRKYSRKK